MMSPTSKAEFKEWWLALLVGGLAWLWIFPQVLIGLHWHDTSEFIASSRTLALSHPPGHPLTLIFMHITQLIPFFDCAERSHLASSFWGGLGVGVMYLALFDLLIKPNALASLKQKFWARFSLVLTALCSACLPLVLLQLTRAEVYAPQWACTAVIWYSLFYAQKYQDQRAYLVTAFFLGLLSTNHTLLALALIIGVFPKLLSLKLTKKVWGLSSCAYLIALSLYAYLWFRGTAGGLSGWGWVVDLNSLWDTISAKVWQVQVEQRSVEYHFIDNIFRMLAFGMRQIGLVMSLMLALILGLASLNWIKGMRATSSLKTLCRICQGLKDGWGGTLLWASLLILMTKLTYPFSEGNPDFSGYLATAVPSLILLCALGIKQFAQQFGSQQLDLVSQSYKEYLISAIIFGVLLVSISLQSHSSRPPASRSAEAWGRAMMQEVPAGGTLWTSFYASHFITVALQSVEGWRSDINLVFRGHRRLDWSLPRLNTLAKPKPLNSISKTQDLMQSSSRFEIERSLDAVPMLWPKLSWPNTRFGFLSSCFKNHCNQLHTDHLAKPVWWREDRLKYNLYLLSLGDARYEVDKLSLAKDKNYIIDEDGAYAWALHYEMSVRWLSLQAQQRRLSYPESQKLEALIYDSQALKEFWIKVIAEEKWDSVDFSFSDP